MKIKLLIIISTLFLLFSCNSEINNLENNNINKEKEFDFSKYYTDQCPEGEFMTSWIKYPDGTVKVDKCTKSFSCPDGKKIISQCSSMIGDVPCKIYCIGKNDPVPEW